MTREEALKDYVDCEKMIENLIQKRANLKKLILGEIVPPSPEIKRASQIKGRGIVGKSRELVGKFLADNSHKQLSTREIVDKTGLRLDQVSAALYRLESMHMVRRHKSTTDKSVTWSTTVHKDQSDLNHL